MGIFGALTTAVTGMRAQSFALENISGNIANSQTTAYKRLDTSFENMIADASPSQQVAGSVTASSRATNNVQGDIQSASISTFMAINGNGYFIVQKPQGFSDNTPTFSGVNLYTRRGDFQLDANGYLVNTAGYYLMGLPVDSTTGNPVGSVPQVLQFNNNLLPAHATTQIQYGANLPSIPKTNKSATANIAGSELLNPADFEASPLAGVTSVAKIIGTGAKLTADAPAVVTGTADISGSWTYTASTPGGSDVLTINGINVTINDGDNATAVQNAINTAMTAQPSGVKVTASLSGGDLRLTSVDAKTNIDITGNATVLTGLGLTAGITQANNLITQGAVAPGQTLTIQYAGGTPQTITFGTGPGQVQTLQDLNTALSTAASALGITASVDPVNGNLTITGAGTAPTDSIVLGGSVSFANFGVKLTTALPANGTIVADDVPTFLNESISGGTTTVYDSTGAPANVQIRWAKVDSVANGGTDTWQMFYQVNSNATGTQVAWKNAGVNFTFGPNGQMSPIVSGVTLNNLVIDGVSLGNVQMNFAANGLTQFADTNGQAQVNQFSQNGYPAGSLQSIAVDDKGHVVGTYSNNRTLVLAQITLAGFNAPNQLKSLDGGAFVETLDSGTPILGASGKIVGSSLEGSNTDIADEFTKLIVTQQAYSANTRVITTSNTMVQDLLNMLR